MYRNEGMSTEVIKDAARASKEAKRQQKHQTTSKHGSSVSITIHTSENIRAYFGDACQLCRKPRPKGEPYEKQKIPPRMDIQICHVVSRTKSADYEVRYPGVMSTPLNPTNQVLSVCLPQTSS